MTRLWYVTCACGWHLDAPVPLDEAKALVHAHERQWPGDKPVICRWASGKPVRGGLKVQRLMVRR